jgi:hypothetical protein
MSQHMTHSDRPTSAWVNFSYICFVACPDGAWGYFRASAGLVDTRLLRNGNVDSILPNARQDGS